MRSRARTTLLLFGVTAALAVGGIYSAWATWTTGANPGSLGATGAQLPRPNAPHTEQDGNAVEIAWQAPPTSLPIDGYRIVRTGSAGTDIVCTVPAAKRTCVDESPPAGAPLTYTVRVTLADWVGPSSEPSDTVTIHTGTIRTGTGHTAEVKRAAAAPVVPEPQPADAPAGDGPAVTAADPSSAEDTAPPTGEPTTSPSDGSPETPAPTASSTTPSAPDDSPPE